MASKIVNDEFFNWFDKNNKDASLLSDQDRLKFFLWKELNDQDDETNNFRSS